MKIAQIGRIAVAASIIGLLTGCIYTPVESSNPFRQGAVFQHVDTKKSENVRALSTGELFHQ